LVKDFTGVQLEIEAVENDKVFFPAVGDVEIKFDLFAEDKKNRVIVEAQHASRSDNFDRFLYYHCSNVGTIINLGNSKKLIKIPTVLGNHKGLLLHFIL